MVGVNDSDVLFTAIHGGGIEGGTSELAMFSGALGYDFYCFEGWRSSGNTDLHVTSTNFDEPNAVRIHKRFDYVVSYHGYYAREDYNTKIGGLDEELKEVVLDKLLEAGFNAEIEPPESSISGVNPSNITNMNKRGMGLQLEISTPQRSAFFETNSRPQRRHTTTEEFHKYIETIIEAVELVKA